MKIIHTIAIVLTLASNLQGQCCLNLSTKSDWTKILEYESKEEISIKKKIKIKVEGFLGFSREEDFEIHFKINCHVQSYYKTPCKFALNRIQIVPSGRLNGKLMETDEYRFTHSVGVFFDTSLIKFEDGSIYSISELISTNPNFEDAIRKTGRFSNEALQTVLKKQITKVLFSYKLIRGDKIDTYHDEFPVTGNSRYMLMNFAKCIIENKSK